MNLLFEGIKLRFSEFIASDVPINRREYYYEKINSIPDNILDTKLPFMIKPKLRKLDKIITGISEEMKNEGIDISKLQISMSEFANELNKLRGI